MNKPLIIWVCGTDTDAGKTVITAGLLASLHQNGEKVQALKLVQTGCSKGSDGNLISPDVQVYNQAAPLAPARALRVYEEACSPHLAARQSGRSIDADRLAQDLIASAMDFRVTVVETAGGLLSPLNDHECALDVLAALPGSLRTKIALVVPNKLGAINQARLGLEILKNRGLKAACLIIARTSAVNGPSSAQESLDTLILQENINFIRRAAQVDCLTEIPYFPALASSSDEIIKSAILNKAWAEMADLLRPAVDNLTAFTEPDSSTRLAAAGENTRELLDFDRQHLWHPYTSAANPLKSWEAYKTQGTSIWLRRSGAGEIDFDGQVTDGMASWWAAVHGYNHPALLKALAEQTALMPHVMFGGLTHEPAVTLAQKLLNLVPSSMRHVFLADSGSVSVEVALKMALQYQVGRGSQNKNSVLTVCGGYHGDTLGAMSVCDPVNGMHHLFSGLLPRQIFAPRPACRFDEPYDGRAIEPLKNLFEQQGRIIAAVIIEPIVQGAGGMWFYHPDYLKQLKTLCERHGALLILDEIATGFGRTGKMFAAQWAGVEPDIMCVGKALTGGVMSLAAVMTTAEVADGISRKGQVLMHGPTFMGNPLACAVAGASLDLLAVYPWESKLKAMESRMRLELGACLGLTGVRDVRVLGGIGVVEMDAPVNVEKIQDYFVREHGVWIRPFGRLIYIMPPYIISQEDLSRLCTAIRAAVEAKKWA